MKMPNLNCEIIPSCNQIVYLVFGEGWNSVSIFKFLLALGLCLKLWIEVLGSNCSCPFFELSVGTKCCHKENLDPRFSQLLQVIEGHQHQLREQNHAGCERTGVWLLQLSLLRLRVSWGRFWVMQRKGVVSASPWSHCPWIPAWADCLLLAPSRAWAGPCWSSCLGGTLMLLEFLHASAFSYSSLWSSGLPHSFS